MKNKDNKIIEKMKEFQSIIGYTFNNDDFVLEALTHSSYSNENKKFNFNERFEFLGDSVLSIVVSDYLFKQEKELLEGELSKQRATIVCEKALCEVAKQINLGDYLLLGKGEESTGGRVRSSILADAVEAVIAAIYLDGGLEKSREFIMKFFGKIIEDTRKGNIFRDYKTHLQEVLQKDGSIDIWYKVVDEKGPDHNKEFIVQVGSGNRVLGMGKGKSKKEAEQHAAKVALEQKKC